MTKIHQVKVTLKGDDLKRFNSVKEFYGVDADAEVLRICLTNAWKEIGLNNLEGAQ